MNEEMEDIPKGVGQEIVCPRCHKVHRSGYAIMDEYVTCECGFQFYAFSDSGLRIIMPQNEAGYEPIARAMRRFVVTTGRCQDIPPELYQEENGQLYIGAIKKAMDVEDELERVLEEFQREMFGEVFLSKDVIFSVCESFQDGHDVELRKQKKRIDVIKLIKKKLPIEEKHHWPGAKTFIKADQAKNLQLAFPTFGIMRNGQTQKKEQIRQ